MKKTSAPAAPPKARVGELQRRALDAHKRAEAAKKDARDAKQRAREARRLFKAAKKVAKKARQELDGLSKKLKKLLAAAGKTRSPTPAATAPSKTKPARKPKLAIAAKPAAKPTPKRSLAVKRKAPVVAKATPTKPKRQAPAKPVATNSADVAAPIVETPTPSASNHEEST